MYHFYDSKAMKDFQRSDRDQAFCVLFILPFTFI